ncbi:hypothetical protein GCM10022243_14510 [Saccharothrix violaceirubra]
MVLVAVVAAQLLATTAATAAAAHGPRDFEVQSYDGSGNNRAHPEWGRAGEAYPRVAPAHYADGIGAQVAGPAPRRVSNRVFDSRGQNLFSPRGVSQWSTAWGQFVDHTFGLRANSAERGTVRFDPADPLERFTSDLPTMPFSRSTVVPGTGVTTPRQQPNTLGSYLDAYAVYGADPARLEWMREGPVDGDPTNNGARLLLPADMLPRRDARGDTTTAPGMDTALGATARLAVAGDIRANENIALLAVQTLFAREHNRIVARLPEALGEETRFQLARRVVIATQQWITYQEFLPSLGVRLKPYQGYRPTVDAGIGNEFATVGYRAHSMVADEITVTTEATRYPAEVRETLRAQGVRITDLADGRLELTVPPSIIIFNPDLLDRLQLGPVLQGLGARPQARNDELIGDVVRSVELRSPDCPPTCLKAVLDIAAFDIERSRDHGMPSYNDLRRAYGLTPKPTFRAITGEATESFPTDPELTPGAEIDDPNSLDFVKLYDARGATLEPGTEAAKTSAVRGVRRTTTAARLKALYNGDMSTVDAFAGMMSEPPVPGTEFGELQLAIWKRQFEALRDGNRFHYQNDPVLSLLNQRYGIDYRQSLTTLIAKNTDIPRNHLPQNPFFTH